MIFTRPVLKKPPVTGLRTVFFDTFTDTDNTLLVDHVPDIDEADWGWSVIERPNNVIIVNNRFRYNNIDRVETMYTNQGYINQVITADCQYNLDAAASANILFRREAITDYIQCGLVTFNAGGGRVRFGIMTVNGGFNVIAQQDVFLDPDPTKFYAVRATQSGPDGDTFRYEIPELSVDISATTSFNRGQTRTGFRCYTGSGPYVEADNFRMEVPA